MKWVALLVFASALAGCTQPAGAPESAHDFVAEVVALGEARVPSHPAHGAAAQAIHAMMAVDGWTTSIQSFDGATYQGHDLAAGSSWRTSCGQTDAAQVADLQFHNLVAKTGPADPMIWFGAHWDAKEDASDGGYVPSANDGASGVGVLLHLMRHLPTTDFGVGILFFDGEDGFEDCHPLAGSVHFAATMEDGLVDAFVLLDMVGDADARFVLEGHSRASAPDLQDLIWKHGRLHAPTAFTNKTGDITDDHLPFIEKGVPSVDIIDAGRNTFPPYWHTSRDTMANIDAGMLDAVEATLMDVLTDPALPAMLASAA